MDGVKELADKLISWIREQVTNAGSRGVVFGLSGGLDSAVVAVLCKMAFPNNVLAVILPCYSSETDLEHAQALASEFDIPTETIALEEAFEALLRSLPEDDYLPNTKRLAESNMKPRLRMLTLYYLASRLGYLVVGTSNRSELDIGYFTKHGDGGVDIMPLGNLLKSQVRELAIHLGIPREIIERPPSAGLWEGQTDEAEIGVTYEELDRYLGSGEVNEQARQRIDEMIARSAHKRAMPLIPSF